MNNELLERIERLEQAIQDIWASCSCLRKDLDDGMDEFNCEPQLCSDCEQMDCICELAEQECPGSVCFECGGECFCELKELNEEESPEGDDHD